MSSGSPPPSPSNSDAGMVKDKPFVTRIQTVINGIAEGNPQQVVALVIGILVGILTLAVLFWLTRRKKRGRTIMIAGICESGKTSMFARLVHKQPVATYTSARENFGKNHNYPPGKFLRYTNRKAQIHVQAGTRRDFSSAGRTRSCARPRPGTRSCAWPRPRTRSCASCR